MANGIKISLKQADAVIERNLAGWIDRARSTEDYIRRVVLEQYRAIQRARWMSENATEGTKWDNLSSDYAKRKKSLYRAYPGAGSRMMIATGRLYKSVIGPGEGFREVITPRSITLSSSVEYAKYADESRTFSTYRPETIAKIRQGFKDFVIKNKINMARAF